MLEFLMRFFKKLFFLLLAFFLIGLLCLIPAYIVVFKILPLKDPDFLFNRNTIIKTLSGETRVFYNDAQTHLGAFFDINHRVYVPYGEIPEDIVNALVAAEDARFWKHNGFDFRGFSRAMLHNIRLRKLRQGGSTLTQQTVKNIFGREETSVKEKWKELINALRMEKHFNKEDILEFYLNQFHVSGTGKGVAIAAQYFFDKNARDLSLAECAFIAGSVKGPFNYDPFIQKTLEAKEAAIQRGEARLKYVLDRMVSEKYISAKSRDSALATPLQFKHGDFRFSLSTTLAMIEEQLNSEFYHDIFEKYQIEDWKKAQLQIITTLDADYQDAASRAMQNNISNLQVRLGGFTLPKAEFPNRATKARKGDYLYGSIDSVAYDTLGKINEITLSFGQLKGFVDSKALAQFGKSVQGDPNKILAAHLARGAILLVSVIDTAKVNGRVPCKIETEPELQGALLAIQNGKLLANQAGFHNTGYNRSFNALRQFASSWKPLLFGLAIQHHWNYLDEIENTFNLFQYQDQFYFPRPDHKDKGDVVSILWAATRSENIASVWLLEHLLDKLSDEEYQSVAMQNNYLQLEEESDRAYYERLRDDLGLTLTAQAKNEIEFSKAKARLVKHYEYEGFLQKARNLKQLFYGRFVEKALKQKTTTADQRKLLNHNFLRYKEILRTRSAKELDPDLYLTLPPLESIQLFEHFNLADFKRLTTLIEPTDPEDNYYDIQSLRHWPDFNRSLAMAEFARFLKQIGVQQKLQKVPSMSLGVNDISLAELTVAYQTLLTGKTFKALDGDWNDVSLIQEIRDKNGRILFKNEMETQKILNDTTTAQMGVLLRSVFENGTARSQVQNIKVYSKDKQVSLLYPVLGKTGTTNSYRNVAFVGAIPTYNSNTNGITLDSVISVGSYVGFDNNKPLQSGRTRIAGASGALPQWAEFSQEVIQLRKESDKIDFLDMKLLSQKKLPIQFVAEKGSIPVSAVTGLIDTSSGVRLIDIPWIDISGYSPYMLITQADTNSNNMDTAANRGIDSLSSKMRILTDTSLFLQNQLPTNKLLHSSSPEEDWELPADFSGKAQFVPIEPDFDNQ